MRGAEVPDEKSPDPPRGANGAQQSTFSRRGFLTGLGASLATVGLGGGIGVAAEAAAERDAPPAGVRPRPLIGALYEPGFHAPASFWRALPERRLTSSFQTHRLWAKSHGIDFFLVSYRHDRADLERWRLIDRMFQRTDPSRKVRIGLRIASDGECEDLVRLRAMGLVGRDAFVNAAAEWVAERFAAIDRAHSWFNRRSYLTMADGRCVLGIPEIEDPATTAAILRRLANSRPEVVDRSCLWYLGSYPDASGVTVVGRAIAALRGCWVAREPLADWQRTIATYRRTASISGPRAISVSPGYLAPGDGPDRSVAQRDGGARLSDLLTEVAGLKPAPEFVLINSFNNWRTWSAIEPGTQSGLSYLEAVRRWRLSVA
jgi:hypothetical protein